MGGVGGVGAGSSENKAQVELELGLSLARIFTLSKLREFGQNFRSYLYCHIEELSNAERR